MFLFILKSIFVRFQVLGLTPGVSMRSCGIHVTSHLCGKEQFPSKYYLSPHSFAVAPVTLYAPLKGRDYLPA